MFLTFAMLFSGFLMLGIENSLTLALIIALVDILPILGVGTVLVPWSVILIVNGESELGMGLLVLFIAIYLVRQYAEPKIVSAQMDVHPLIVLFAMYAGLKLAGILGLIFAPLIVFVIKTVYVSFKKEKTVDKGA
jgi:predicted PurR-regulated permease PerM